MPPLIATCPSPAARMREANIQRAETGGEGGIRTHVTVARKPHFECGAFDLSATSPQGCSSTRQGRAVALERRG